MDRPIKWGHKNVNFITMMITIQAMLFCRALILMLIKKKPINITVK